MQVAIDSAKRRFDINVTDEIHRIKELVKVKKNGYPSFWSGIRYGFNKHLINKHLRCPMSAIFKKPLGAFPSDDETIPFSHFFVPHKMNEDRKQPKKIEDLIEEFALKLYRSRLDEDDDASEEYLLLRYDYDMLIARLRQMSLSKNQTGLISWLINRAFLATPSVQSNRYIIQSNLMKNKAILLKTLYDLNKRAFFSCFLTPPSQN